MMPPTSIDGTDITGATIDGTEVQEITVDGQTVFSAGPSNFPVAYSNLIAWYPFDSATYSGSNADDVTAILGGSGDDTAYDGSVSGATYQSSGGVTDINAGANSGAFEFDGSNDVIDIGTGLPDANDTSISITLWANADSTTDKSLALDYSTSIIGIGKPTALSNFGVAMFDSAYRTVDFGVKPLNEWHHFGLTYNSSTNVLTGYFDGVSKGTASVTGVRDSDDEYTIGGTTDLTRLWDGLVDDVRIYNTDLTDQQIQDIYDNTPHP